MTNRAVTRQFIRILRLFFQINNNNGALRFPECGGNKSHIVSLIKKRLDDDRERGSFCEKRLVLNGPNYIKALSLLPHRLPKFPAAPVLKDPGFSLVRERNTILTFLFSECDFSARK